MIKIKMMENLKNEIQKLKSGNLKSDAYRKLKSADSVKQIFYQSIEPAIYSVMNTLSEFEDLFIEKEFWLGDGNGAVSIKIPPDVRRNFDLNRMECYQQIQFKCSLKGYRNPKILPFNVELDMLWKLEEYYYVLNPIDKKNQKRTPLQYDIFYTQEDVAEIANQCAFFILNQVKEKNGP